MPEEKPFIVLEDQFGKIHVYLRVKGERELAPRKFSEANWVYLERESSNVFSKPYIGLDLEDFLLISSQIREVRDGN